MTTALAPVEVVDLTVLAACEWGTGHANTGVPCLSEATHLMRMTCDAGSRWLGCTRAADWVRMVIGMNVHTCALCDRPVAECWTVTPI